MSLAAKLHEGMKRHAEKHREKKSVADKEVNKTGEVDHFEVHPAEGGHMLETHYKRPDSKRGEYMEAPKPKKAIHKSMNNAMKDMKSQCPCGNCGEPDTAIVAGKNGKDEDDTEEY
jgi:hypothetical protein